MKRRLPKYARWTVPILILVPTLAYLNHPNSRFNRQQFEQDCRASGIGLTSAYEVLEHGGAELCWIDCGYLRTWKVRSITRPSAGFTLDESPPKPDDLGYVRWKMGETLGRRTPTRVWKGDAVRDGLEYDIVVIETEGSYITTLGVQEDGP